MVTVFNFIKARLKILCFTLYFICNKMYTLQNVKVDLSGNKIFMKKVMGALL